MRDTAVVIERLQELRELGVRLAIDDFGTGYSSLSYLERFPIDILKIDKSFVDGIASTSDESAPAAAIVKLSRALGMEAVAEGIESPDQVERLLGLHCGFGQGYHFAKPLPAGELESLLMRGPRAPCPKRPPSSGTAGTGTVRGRCRRPGRTGGSRQTADRALPAARARSCSGSRGD